MFKIISKEIMAHSVKSYIIDAPDIAKNAKAGQFVMLRIDDKGERIPLTVAGADSANGLIRIIFQEAGKTTKHLGRLGEGDYIKDILGPLGIPTEIKKYGTVAAVAGGVGTAEVLPVIKYLRAEGNKIISIVGARNKDLILLENEIKQNSDELVITTDDGSAGIKGFVTTALGELVKKGVKIDMVYAIGPVPMMKSVSNLTKECSIPAFVSLNPIMVDGTGMCGACRVTVDGKTRFACVEGPEFDAHKIDWDELISRLSLFRELEKISDNKFSAENFVNENSCEDNPECKCRKK
ncbi:MAG: sulfide/dihydroorotate dehydrogenase-like FAD/NAD-binding protein [Endomicrobium sp.]|jgi:ferredoxin--NADP+ reductase|nr:sulfide/dihydroorotate dehydrogenase-like FAD/NAD-binding protein [Endomicrobium sp.]